MSRGIETFSTIPYYSQLLLLLDAHFAWASIGTNHATLLVGSGDWLWPGLAVWIGLSAVG